MSPVPTKGHGWSQCTSVLFDLTPSRPKFSAYGRGDAYATDL
jgi:hypothetical protein